MPERTAVGTRTQLGVESVSGTTPGGGANKLFDSFTIVPTPKENTRDFTGQGNVQPTYANYTYGETDAAIAGWPSYVADVYLWSSLFGAANIAGVGAGSFGWTFSPSATDADTPKSLYTQFGSSVLAGAWNYGVVTDLGWSWDRTGKIDLTGKMIGQQYTSPVTLTSSPTLVPDVPFNAVDYQVYLDTTSGGLGGTRLTRVVSSAPTVPTKYKPWYPSDRSKTSYSFVVPQPYKLQHKLTLEADSNGMALLSDIRANTNLFLRHEFQGAVMPGENIQTLTMSGSPTGGTFTLTYKGQTTAGIAYNAAASAVQSALQLLSTVGTNMTVSGSNGGPWTVVLAGALAQDTTDLITANNGGLTGGTSPAVGIVASPNFYLFRWDHACFVSSIGELKDENGIIGYDVTLDTRYDATWGKSQVLLIQNQLSGL